MIQHELQQGSPEWHAHRATTWNASDAPAMMGVSQNTTRGELLRMYATGITKGVSDWVQKFLFDKGHDTEAKARAPMRAAGDAWRFELGAPLNTAGEI